MKTIWERFTDGFTLKKITWIVLGAAICSFGIYNIPQQTGITEGGVLGMMPVSYTHLDVYKRQ